MSNSDKIAEPVVAYDNRPKCSVDMSEWVDRSGESKKYKQWIDSKLDKSINNLKSGAILSRDQYNQILDAKFGKLGG